MIVKNERPVIERCLNSVKDIIDYWVIVDTGSTDGTQEVIRECLKKIPGELHERPWVNFAHNRNEALHLAQNRSDYLLLIDADEVWHPLTEQTRPADLNKDAYYLRLKREPESKRIFLIRNAPIWRWKGVLHEQLLSFRPIETGTLSSFIVISDTFDGNRSKDPQKWLKDAEILEKGLQEEPNNLDYLFYLAQSYANAKEYSKALKYYEERASKGGEPELVFWSLYVAAKLKELLGHNEEELFKAYNLAYKSRPFRREPLYHLARRAFLQKNFLTAYLLAKEGIQLPYPEKEFGYVEKWIYEYGMLVEFANAAFQLGKIEEAKEAWRHLLQAPTSPDKLKQEVEKLLLLDDQVLKKAK